MSFAFVGKEDRYQLVSSLLLTIFAIFGFLVVFFMHYKFKKSLSLNYVAWFTLFVVTLLELIFLISMIVNANAFAMIRTNYSTIRISYMHSGKQIIIMFVMGLVSILALMVECVAA